MMVSLPMPSLLRPDFAIAAADFADGVDDGDFLAGAGGLFGVIGAGDQLDHFHEAGEPGEIFVVELLLAVIFDEGDGVDMFLIGELLAEFVDVGDAIDEAGIFRGGGGEQAFVDQVFNLAGIELAIGGDGIDELGVVIVEDRIHLLFEFGAHVFAGEGFGGAFVIAHLEEVGVDAEFLEQLFEVHEFHPDAGDRDHADGGHDDFVAGAGEQIFGAGAFVEAGVDFFARLANAGDGGAELVELAAADAGFVDLENDAGDLVIGGGLIEALDHFGERRFQIAEHAGLAGAFRIGCVDIEDGQRDFGFFVGGFFGGFVGSLVGGFVSGLVG